MYKKIGEYGVIGNLRTVALVGFDGSIDWLCLPYLDSPSVFGAILDDKKGGRFSISPAQDYDSVSEYVRSTNILKTIFRTRTGTFELTDFMPLHYGCDEEMEEAEHELYRVVEVTKGTVEVSCLFEPRFDYASVDASLENAGCGVVALGRGESLALSSTHELEVDRDSARGAWSLAEGQRVLMHLRYGATEPEEIGPENVASRLQETAGFWRDWLEKSETGCKVSLGPYKGMVDRSALVLKLLYYGPTGAIAAAATTSLPEEVGGVRNWDYRYTWIRDTSFTLAALFNLGHLAETEGYIRWIENLISGHGVDKIRIMYGLRGEEDLTEHELLHLDGYKGSRPVRIGNGAAEQKQMDIYGELMDAALKLSDYVGKIDTELWPFLRSICEHVVEHWRQRDSGIWEVRGGPYHFVYSKVMCWVALDRGIKIAKRYGFPAELERWEEELDAIKAEVLKRGWSDEKNSFIQHYETDALDSSNLLMPLLGFLPTDDPRVSSTVEAIRRELGRDGFLYRYLAEDHLEGGEGTFLLCTFWLIDNLIAMGSIEEAEGLLKKIEAVANPLGLFPEQYDVGFREHLGNFPQAFTHIGYINSVIALRQAKGEAPEERGRPRRLLLGKIMLNDRKPRVQIPSREMAARLKGSMNLLRGAFFDRASSRVAYERMPGSEPYENYVELSACLKNMDLRDLATREERLAFWINLYNVIVIHGVVELGIKDSVKEVRNFFKRVQYRIGSMVFSPDDMEHGILRSNSRPPNSLFKVFGSGDPRLEYVISPVDPRIHFALVCASSSCPPIAFYTPESIDRELDVAAATFLNSGGAVVDRSSGAVSLSRIFRWYRGDFGRDRPERLRFIALYMYRDEDREFLEENAGSLKVSYQDYDWRLNRY